MKQLIAVLLIIIPFVSYSQHAGIARDWKKEKDRIMIDNKMNELLNRVSFEFECDINEILYTVTEKYSFYGRKRDMMNFPKKLTLKVCGNTLYYMIKCKPNSYGKPKGWIMGEWMEDPEFKE